MEKKSVLVNTVVLHVLSICIISVLLIKSIVLWFCLPLLITIIYLFKKDRKILIFLIISLGIAFYYSSFALVNGIISENGNIQKLFKRFMTLICFLGVFLIGNKFTNDADEYCALGKSDKRTLLFFLVSCLATIVGFVPFIKISEKMLVFSLLFALINAPLEEYIWRGVILSKLRSIVGFPISLIITSVLFGLSHYHLGFSFYICGLFTIGGMLFALLVKKTNGIFYSTIIHLITNICMGMSGII